MEIIFDHVYFDYQKMNCTNKLVFKDLNITFTSGKIHGIIGKNGSGKTTMLSLIHALVLPKKGSIKVGDCMISSNTSFDDISNLRFNIGYSFQLTEEQFFNSTVYDELSFNLHYYNYHLHDIKKRISDVLKMVGLDDTYLYRNPFYLSKGEQRKLSLALALVHNPKIILLDEPTRGLDSQSQVDLIKLLRLLKNRYHKTILISSSDTDFLHAVVDNVYVLGKNNIVLVGDKYEIFRQEKYLRRYGIKSPKIIQFSNLVLTKKKIKIGYRDEVNDLIKDIYRYVK